MTVFFPPKPGQIVLRPFSEAHVSDVYLSWLRDPAVTRFSEQRHRTHSRGSALDYRRRMLQAGNLFLAVHLGDGSEAHIGNITASFDAPNRVADIGILLGAPQARGRGIGYEAWMKMMALVAETGRADKITGGCLAPNVAMVRIMEKAGMQPDGRRVAQMLWEGQRVDVVHFAAFPLAGMAQADNVQ